MIHVKLMGGDILTDFKTKLRTMKKNDDTVQVYVDQENSIYTGYIEEVGVDCLVMTFERGFFNAVIPLDKILMVSVVKTGKKK